MYWNYRWSDCWLGWRGSSIVNALAKEAFSIGVVERHVDPANTVVINFRTESGKGVYEKARWMSLLFD